MKLKLLKQLVEGHGYMKIALLIGLGLLLIFFGMGGDTADTSERVDTLETDITELCSSLEGVGQCRVLVTYEERSLGYGKGTESVISGIAVVCEGGESVAVKQRVSSVLSSVFGIGANRIRVEKLGGYQ